MNNFLTKEVYIHPLIKPVLAVIIGLVFFKALYLFWSFFPSWNPFFNYLLNCCVAAPWLKPLIYTQDMVINVLLCSIPASLLIKLNHKNLYLILALAVLPSFVLHNYHLFTEPVNSSLTLFIPSWFNDLALLPIVALIIFKLISNNNAQTTH